MTIFFTLDQLDKDLSWTEKKITKLEDSLNELDDKLEQANNLSISHQQVAPRKPIKKSKKAIFKYESLMGSFF